jgi:hypothetical protein
MSPIQGQPLVNLTEDQIQALNIAGLPIQQDQARPLAAPQLHVDPQDISRLMHEASERAAAAAVYAAAECYPRFGYSNLDTPEKGDHRGSDPW